MLRFPETPGNQVRTQVPRYSGLKRIEHEVLFIGYCVRTQVPRYSGLKLGAWAFRPRLLCVVRTQVPRYSGLKLVVIWFTLQVAPQVRTQVPRYSGLKLFGRLLSAVWTCQTPSIPIQWMGNAPALFSLLHSVEFGTESPIIFAFLNVIKFFE